LKYSYAINVVVPIPIDGFFTYSLSKSEFFKIKIGSRVIVSFGKKKYYTAVVFEKHENYDVDYELKEISYLIDEPPCITSEQIIFINWLSDYYLSPIGVVLDAVLPRSFLIKSESVLKKVICDKSYKNEDYDYEILQLFENNEEILVNELVKIFGFKVLKRISGLISQEILELNEEIYTKYKEKTVINYSLNQSRDPSKIFLRSDNQKKVLNYLYENKNSSFSKNHIQDVLGVSVSVLENLAKRDILLKNRVPVKRIYNSRETSIKELVLSDSQKDALNGIKKSFLTYNVVNLLGITSSGKTEIYVNLIKEEIVKGNSALLMVPEIALTTQLSLRLSSYFPSNLIVYHSSISPNMRHELWSDMVNNDKPKVILGARSSVFLPFKNLGIIIIDEEHENSYKQNEPMPRYNARDSAILLSKILKTKCLLGSATPSVETYYNSINKKYGFVELNKRYGNFKEPKITLIESPKLDNESFLSLSLRKEIKLCLENNHQIILFRNRRGFSTFLKCKACSNVNYCPNCDVCLTYHISENLEKCHYCSFSRVKQIICSSCNLPSMELNGIGTQTIENELEKFFPNVKSQRLDYDTTRSRKKLKKILQDFSINKFQILIGTQMVSKGLDFSNVGLVGVIESDFLLNYPDFRSHEKYFQLIKQVSGRAGRSISNSKVLIQTNYPNHHVHNRIIDGNTKGFYQFQIDQRRDFNYPPFTRLAKVILKSKNINVLKLASNWFSKALKNTMKSEILGPEFPVVSKIKNDHIMNILIKMEVDSLRKEKKKLFKLSKKINKYSQFKSVKLSVDIDPYN